MPGPVYLGCPVWAHPPWVGTFFTRKAKREEFLPQYASVFDTAEGNSTFYGLPSMDTVRRWSGEAPAHFRFCFKFPRRISHDLRLAHAEADTAEFLARLEPLAGRLGPFFLQVHATFGPQDLPVLAAYLAGLPREFAYAVEVRHAAFFKAGGPEDDLNAVLGDAGVNRVIFDTRGLFASGATDPFTIEAKRKKPNVSGRFMATGSSPFIRFVGDPDIEKNVPKLQEWAAQVSEWIAEGRTPFFFAHHPEDTLAPKLARRFQGLLHERVPSVPPPAKWPVESEESAMPAGQMEMF